MNNITILLASLITATICTFRLTEPCDFLILGMIWVMCAIGVLISFVGIVSGKNMFE